MDIINQQISKALMLQKGAEYIHQLKSERQQLTEKADQLRAEIEALSNDIRWDFKVNT